MSQIDYGKNMKSGIVAGVIPKNIVVPVDQKKPFTVGDLLDACAVSDMHAMGVILREGVDPNFRWKEGVTCMHMAACVGDVAMIALLLAANADPNVRCLRGETPLFLAVGKNHIDAVAALGKGGADVTIANNDRVSPLHLAFCLKSDAMCEVLLNLGADPAARDEDGRLPEHFLFGRAMSPGLRHALSKGHQKNLLAISERHLH